MKVSGILFQAIGLVIALALAVPGAGRSQDAAGTEVTAAFTSEQLAQMLAPIALYPDALLSQILMASTYPIEVIEADRWLKRNPSLLEAGLDEALRDKDWDPSVKALCHFPSVLALMSERITETTSLGNAFLAQETEVMAMIQKLRAEAYGQGSLTSTPEQKVVVEKETIIIEPANPEVVYVPYYDPLSVYGPWWYPAYPPYHWGPHHVTAGAGIFFWPGPFVSFSVVSWSRFDWHRRHIFIDIHKRPGFFRHNDWRVPSGPWYHAPRHRRGVAYRDKPTARKFGKAAPVHREFRRDIRGFPEHGGRDGRGGGPPPRGIVKGDDRRGSGIVSGRGDRERRGREQDLQRKGIVSVPGDGGKGRGDQGGRGKAGSDLDRQVKPQGDRVGGGLRGGKTRDRSGGQAFGIIGSGKQERESSRRGRLSREGQQRNMPSGGGQEGRHGGRDGRR